VRSRAALEHSDARAQAGDERVACPLRNGEEGLAVPVRARRPKPYARRTRTRTWARLWPRDPLQTGGRWDGGWRRLVHGNALATALKATVLGSVAFYFCSIQLRAAGQAQKRNKKRSYVPQALCGPFPRRTLARRRKTQAAGAKESRQLHRCKIAHRPRTIRLIRQLTLRDTPLFPHRDGDDLGLWHVPRPTVSRVLCRQKWDWYIRFIHPNAAGSLASFMIGVPDVCPLAAS
jgi:hypothetical protein